MKKRKAPAARAMAKQKVKIVKNDLYTKTHFMKKKKRLRRAHWRQQFFFLKYKDIERNIECLLEGGGRGRARSNGERNEQKKTTPN